MSLHIPPTRQYMIAFVRERGAKMAYGKTWPLSDADTIAQLSALTDVEYMRQCGCDHCDAEGNCLGHDKVSA
jgi:hypothetical protein